MARREVDFKQGSETTGDSGERGNALGVDKGIASIKPVKDGEIFNAATMTRPTENNRRRTEALRKRAESSNLVIDLNHKWCVTGGNAAGIALTPGCGYVYSSPRILTWAEDTGITDYKFTVDVPLVINSLTTPKSSTREEVTYTFTDPVSSTVQFIPTRQEYDSEYRANDIRIQWVFVPAGDLTAATLPDYCNIEALGDPEHILKISVRDDELTTVAHVHSALFTASLSVGLVGLGFVVSGTAYIQAAMFGIGDTPVTDYVLCKTASRFLFYIPTSVFDDFFAANRGLDDGDTLAIAFDTDQTRFTYNTGINGVTTVTSADLFITTDNPERIPLCFPLCKRVGSTLYWLDGTVVDVNSVPCFFGENAFTINRVNTIPSTQQYSSYTSSVTDSLSHLDITGTPTLQAYAQQVADSMNIRASLIHNEVITADTWSIGSKSITNNDVLNYRFSASTTITSAADTTREFAQYYSYLTKSTASVLGGLTGYLHKAYIASGAGSVAVSRGFYSITDARTDVDTCIGFDSEIDLLASTGANFTVIAGQRSTITGGPGEFPIIGGVYGGKAEIALGTYGSIYALYGYGVNISTGSELTNVRGYSSNVSLASAASVASGIFGYDTYITTAIQTKANSPKAFIGYCARIVSRPTNTDTGENYDTGVYALRGIITLGSNTTDQTYGTPVGGLRYAIYATAASTAKMSSDLHLLRATMATSGGVISLESQTAYGLYLDMGSTGYVSNEIAVVPIYTAVERTTTTPIGPKYIYDLFDSSTGSGANSHHVIYRKAASRALAATPAEGKTLALIDVQAVPSTGGSYGSATHIRSRLLDPVTSGAITGMLELRSFINYGLGSSASIVLHNCIAADTSVIGYIELNAEAYRILPTTSAALPASPLVGMVCFEVVSATEVKMYVHSGTNWTTTTLTSA
jgi:hypothetical protein